MNQPKSRYGEEITQDVIERFRRFFQRYYSDIEDEQHMAEAMQLCALASRALARQASERSESAPSNDAEDAARWRWLLDNATRMSEPLEARRPNSHAITGHRVSLIVDFKGDHTTTPWATQQTFTEHVDMERLSERGG